MIKQKYKLTEEDLRNLNWGKIEKEAGIDVTKEPSYEIKHKIIKGSVFARECKWITNKYLEKEKKRGRKALKEFCRIASR